MRGISLAGGVQSLNSERVKRKHDCRNSQQLNNSWCVEVLRKPRNNQDIVNSTSIRKVSELCLIVLPLKLRLAF